MTPVSALVLKYVHALKNLDSVLHVGKIKKESLRHTWGVSSATQVDSRGLILQSFSGLSVCSLADNEDGQGIPDE